MKKAANSQSISCFFVLGVEVC